MYEAELGRDRDRDREIREAVDALTVELTPQGKMELAVRLAMECARELASGGRRAAPAVTYRELPQPVRELEQKRDSAGRESSTT